MHLKKEYKNIYESERENINATGNCNPRVCVFEKNFTTFSIERFIGAIKKQQLLEEVLICVWKNYSLTRKSWQNSKRISLVKFI